MSELDRYIDLSRRLLIELDSRDRELARLREPIAIIGMACRFPGGEDLHAFEALLRHGRDAIVPVPGDRWSGFGAEEVASDRSITEWGGLLDGVDEFDAGFFRISPLEAEFLDPQQRLLLEMGWRALEDAGINPDRLRGSRTGVFAGISTTDYRELVALSADAASRYMSTGTFASTAAGRVAFALGLEGPTMAIDTACSSSLVALHQAVTALQREEADLALAGGVNAILSASQMAAFANAGMLAPDGRCKTFDARADGYVRGEGCGMVVLRRLTEAKARGDRIVAVISGSAVNQDGASAGLTVPNGPAQERVIRAALARAGIDPAEVDYLEAHGTGTELGDPIELRAASAVYGEGRADGRPLLIGSVKTNIGHLEAAAGIAGVIKVALALRRETIPAHLNFRTPNPRVDWPSLPVRVTKEPTPWPGTKNRPRRAGVSSFGFSGTNAHLLLEGWDENEGMQVPLPKSLAGAPAERRVRLLPLSTRTTSAVPALARRYLAWLDRQDRPVSKARLADFAWTVGTGRTQFEHRAGLAFHHEEDLREALASVASGARPTAAGKVERVGFLFTGQGSQRPGMGRQLYESEPVFRSVLERCDETVRTVRGASLIEAMFEGGDLDDTTWTQPALYALGCGLASLWESVGVRPAVVLGHSVGEIAAAYAAGVFSLEDGARFAAMRGSLMAELACEPGSMAAVFAPVAKVREAIDAVRGLSLAAENGTHCVVSGPSSAMEELSAACRSSGMRVKRIRTGHAFHSALMEPALDAIESSLAGTVLVRPTIPFVSNVSGRVLEDVPDGAYWRRQARETVRFAAGVSTLYELGVDLLIEIGPDAVLGRLAQASWPGDGEPPAVASLTADTSVGEAAAAVWEAGLPFSFDGLFAGETRHRIAAPGHPFQRRRYWLDNRRRRPRLDERPGLGVQTRLANGEVVFDREVTTSNPPWLIDHEVFELTVVPGALWAVMAIAAASLETGAGSTVTIEEARLHAPLILSDTEQRTVQTVLGEPDAEGRRTLEIYSQSEDRADWLRHFDARMGRRPAAAETGLFSPSSLGMEMSPGDPEQYYRSLAVAGMAYGPAFRRIGALWTGSGEAAVEIALVGEEKDGVSDRAFLLDGCLQALPAAAGKDELYLPFGWDRLWLADTFPERVWCRARITETGDELLKADLQLLAADGAILGAIDGFAAKRATRQRLLAAGGGIGGLLYEVAWRQCSGEPGTAADELPTVQEAPSATTWVLVGNAGDVADGIMTALDAHGHKAILVSPMDKEVPEGTARVAADCRESWRPFFEGLGGKLRGVIHLAGIDAGARAMDLDGLAREIREATASALTLCQGLEDAERTRTIDLWFLTRGAQTGPGGASGHPAGSTLWGFARTVRWETDRIRPRLIDLDPSDAGLPNGLIEELLHPGHETELAWRNGMRLASRLAPTPAERYTEPARLNPGGTYLVTGGLRGLGLEVAAWLADRGAATIVLNGRTPPDDVSRNAIEALQARGVRVEAELADIADEAALAALLTRIDDTLPPLVGIVHCAGVFADRTFANLDWEQCEAALRPKVLGSWNLHRLTEGQNLDLFLLFSSVAGTVGNPGQANYAAANAFLDQMAGYRRHCGLAGQSIAWGPWSEIGEAARRRERISDRLEAVGQRWITPREGNLILDRVVGGLAPVTVAAAIDWAKLLGGQEVPALLEEVVPSGNRVPPPALLTRLRTATEGERESLLVTALQAELQAVLRLPEPPPPNIGFFDLGMDSLTAVELRNRLNRMLEGAYTLSSTVAFDFPDIGKLARHLAAELDPGTAVPTAPVRRFLSKADDRIAIVGIGCRFPGGEGLDAFRALLEEGRGAIGPFPKDRWPRELAEAAIDGDPAAFRGGYIDGIDRFDAAFFRIAPVEARHLDPQQRLLLETAWHALEDAGIDPESLRGSRTGVLAGVMNNDYRDLLAAGPEATSAWLASGTMDSTAIGRVAFALGLEGPALAVDTACSSSLVAIHQAIAALQGGEADIMLAGGVNAVLSPVFTRSLVNAGMLATDGMCKTFDARADGYGRGEGCGVVVLKRLTDATADGDRIRAVILGSAVNHDGASAGLTVPNGPAQERVIASALERAGVQSADVDYLEAHGTGTDLGDPIEVHAAAAAYGAGRSPDRPLMIGSVKTNVGHLEGAAGVAGLIKIVLAMESGTIPRHLNFESPNPRIDWERLPIRVVADPAPWPAAGRPPRAGLSSFGFSGTNAHLIVEAWPIAERVASAGGQPATVEPARAMRMLPLSGRAGPAVRDLAQRHLEWLDRYDAPMSEDPSVLADLAWSASVGRSQLDHRKAVIFADRSELRRGLVEISRADPVSPPTTVTKVAFLFTGQGSQWQGMGRALYRSEPVFRAILDRCEAEFRELAGESLLEVMFETGDLDNTAWAQPALYALECGLAELWSHIGVRPNAVLGHSVGEIAAARTAGVLSLEDGLRLAANRGATMNRISRDGAMAAVFATPDQVAEWLTGFEGALSIAADNGTHQVVSGTLPALSGLMEQLAGNDVHVSRLTTSHAFHSEMMTPALDDIEKFAGAIPMEAPTLPLVSNLTGRVMRETPDGVYWRRHAREPVAFMAGVRTLAGLDVDAILELGPQPVLGPLAHQVWPGHKLIVAASQHRDVSNPDGGFLSAAADLWRAGMTVDFKGLFEGESRQRLPLPLYPFQRRRHWVDAEARPTRGGTESVSSGRRTNLAGGETVFEMTLTETSPNWLADHRVFDHIVAPAAFWSTLAIEMSSPPQSAVALEDLQILAPLVIDDGPRIVQATLGIRNTGQGRTFRIHSRGAEGEDWTLHAEGQWAVADPPAESAGESQNPEADDIPLPKFYETLENAGIRYGSAFRRLVELRVSDGRAFGRLATAPGASTTEGLDGCFQVLAAAAGVGGDGLYLPFACQRMWLAGPLPPELSCHARLTDAKGSTALTGDLDIFDAAGEKIGDIRGLALKRASGQALLAAGVEELLHEPTWRPARLGLPRPTEVASDPRCNIWIVATDGSDLAPTLASSLVVEGQRVVLAEEAPAPPVDPAGSVDRIAMPADRNAWQQLFIDQGKRLRGVIWLATVEDDGAGPAATVERTALRALTMIQGLDASGITAQAGISFVTRGAQILDYERAEGLSGAALWGFGRTVQVEAGHLGLRLLDLDPARDGVMSDLTADLLSPDHETEVAWRNGDRNAARLTRIPSTRRSVPLDHGWRLAADAEGVLSGLRYEEVPPRAPGPGEVRVSIEAAGINFHDVLTAMRLVDIDSPLGGDLSGRVIETGPGVTEFAPGDRVMGVAAGSFASEVTVDARLVTAVPSGLSGLAAAALPSVYLTVALAFERASLRRGDRVLIHASAGGVGHAAIALARAMGAKLLATASSGKREYVRQLGVSHVFDSRDPSFGTSLLEATGGSGVDIVLNSLTGQGFIEASLSCLEVGGRFVELSKRDIWTTDEMAVVRPDVDYSVLAVDELTGTDPSLVGRTLRSVVRRLDSGDLPPLPYAAWPMTEAVRAMEAMQAGKHRGKLVLSMPGRKFGREGQAWLVTGGLGGIGLEVAKWLADRRAGTLILNGRRPPGPAAESVIRTLRERGMDVRVELVDIADEAAVNDLMARIDAGGWRLAGIFHCAGVLADGALADQDADRFERVLAAKVTGAWNLHQATRRHELDHFVLFSSVAGALGNVGQANYSAANAWLDQFARYRRARGLAGQSIAWGPWSGVGMAQERRDRIADGVAAAGLDWLSPRQGIAALERIVGQDITSSIIVDADWATLARARQDAPLFEQVMSAATPNTTGTASLMPKLRAATATERPGLLASFLQREIQEVLMLPNPPPITTGFLDLGLNSLMAVEVRNRLNRALAGAFVAPSTILFDFPDVETLASHVLSATGLAESGGEERRDSSDLARIQRRVDSLSDEEFLAETLKKLDSTS